MRGVFQLYRYNGYYSECPIIRPPIILVESGLNGEHVSFMRPIQIENCTLVSKQRSGLNSEGGLNFEWSL